MLWLIQVVFFGPLRQPDSTRSHTGAGTDALKDAHSPLPTDLTWREVLALAPLAVLALWIGLYPKFFLDRMAPELNRITATAAETVQTRFIPEERRVEHKLPTAWESMTRVD
jgi:NADH-quinone oxidoreductase subunit M